MRKLLARARRRRTDDHIEWADAGDQMRAAIRSKKEKAGETYAVDRLDPSKKGLLR
jgi:hypothetical protein